MSKRVKAEWPISWIDKSRNDTQRHARAQAILTDRFARAFRGYATRNDCNDLAFYTLVGDNGRPISEPYGPPQIAPHLRPLLSRRYNLHLERIDT